MRCAISDATMIIRYHWSIAFSKVCINCIIANSDETWRRLAVAVATQAVADMEIRFVLHR